MSPTAAIVRAASIVFGVVAASGSTALGGQTGPSGDCKRSGYRYHSGYLPADAGYGYTERCGSWGIYSPPVYQVPVGPDRGYSSSGYGDGRCSYWPADGGGLWGFTCDHYGYWLRMR
jgi:hypothetical protein